MDSPIRCRYASRFLLNELNVLEYGPYRTAMVNRARQGEEVTWPRSRLGVPYSLPCSVPFSAEQKTEQLAKNVLFMPYRTGCSGNDTA